MKKISFLIIFCLCLVFAFTPTLGGVAMAETDNDVYKISREPDISSVLHTPISYSVNFVYNSIIYPNGSVEHSFSIISNQPNISEQFWNQLEFYLTYMGYQVERDGFSSITGGMQYESLTDLYIASGRDGFEVDTSDNMVITNDGIYKIYTSKSDTIFSLINKENNIVRAINDVLIKEYGASSICYIYQYGTKFKPSFISSSADNVFFVKDMRVHIHQFIFTADEVDNIITLNQKMLNTDIFSALAILVGVIIIIATSFAVKKSRSNDNG